MFTGLIQTLGKLEALAPVQGGMRLTVRPERPLEALAIGESIAVSGACLTVEAGSRPDRLDFFTSAETLSRTILGGLRPGSQVNLERSMQPGDRMGGHIVLGHVDSVGAVRRFEPKGEAWELEVGFPPELAPFIARKGSVAVDGISLTVVELWQDSFTVAVIPHTREATTLRHTAAGARVNLEVDVMARYVVRALEAFKGGGGVSRELLAKAGF